MVKNDKPKTAVGSKAPVEPKEKSPYVKKGMHLVQAKRIRIDGVANEVNAIIPVKRFSTETSTQLSLNSSKYWHSVSQYRNSIIEAVIALEPIIYSAVKKKWRHQGLSETKIKDQLSKVDLNHLITIEISQLINITDQIENEVFTKVLEAVGLRNKIVHRNLLSVSESQSENVTTNIEKMIQLLKKEEKAPA